MGFGIHSETRNEIVEIFLVPKLQDIAQEVEIVINFKFQVDCGYEFGETRSEGGPSVVSWILQRWRIDSSIAYSSDAHKMDM
jgi:hypothetical protein